MLRAVLSGQDLDDDALYVEADDVLKILEEFQEAKLAADFNLVKEKRDRRRVGFTPSWCCCVLYIYI